MSIKFLVLGGGKCRFYFYGRGDFSELRVVNLLWRTERKNVHNHHRKKIFWRTFLASKKNFPGRWRIQKPCKNQESHIYHRNLSSVDPIFLAKTSSALEQGGVRFLFPRA